MAYLQEVLGDPGDRCLVGDRPHGVCPTMRPVRKSLGVPWGLLPGPSVGSGAPVRGSDRKRLTQTLSQSQVFSFVVSATSRDRSRPDQCRRRSGGRFRRQGRGTGPKKDDHVSSRTVEGLHLQTQGDRDLTPSLPPSRHGSTRHRRGDPSGYQGCFRCHVRVGLLPTPGCRPRPAAPPPPPAHRVGSLARSVSSL